MSDPQSFQNQQGFVAYFDLLGFRYLTKVAEAALLEKLDLSWIVDAPTVGEQRRYVLSIVLMIEYRQSLKALLDAYRNDALGVAQLSDAAFVWTSSADVFFEALTDLAHKLDCSGLLWRAGAAKGEIFLPSTHDAELGKFLAGPAVTRSVQVESLLKGARIAMDTTLRDDFIATSFGATPRLAELMFTSTDVPDVIEYRWYAAPWRKGSPLADELFRDGEGQALPDLIAQRAIGRIARFATRKEYQWNCLNPEGIQHMVSSITSTASAVTASKGLSLRIADPSEARRVLLCEKPNHAHGRLQAELYDELQRLELGKSLVQQSGVAWPLPYLKDDAQDHGSS